MVHLAAMEFTDQSAPGNDKYSVEEHRLVDVGRDDQRAAAGREKFADLTINFLARADIDASRGIAEYENPATRAKPFAEDDLLLISPAQGFYRVGE